MIYEDNAMNLESNGEHLGGNTLDLDSYYWNGNKTNGIFVVSKQFSEETLNIFYGENVFRICLHKAGEFWFRDNFTKANRQRIRYLLLVAQPMGVPYDIRRMPENPLWSSILPTLKGLRIVAEQPVEALSYDSALPFEQEMDRWVKWIEPFLQCLGRYLSSETIVQVDFNGKAETRELVEECLPYGYREIRCRHIGDYIFKRGQFSWNSGYWDEDDRKTYWSFRAI